MSLLAQKKKKKSFIVIFHSPRQNTHFHKEKISFFLTAGLTDHNDKISAANAHRTSLATSTHKMLGAGRKLRPLLTTQALAARRCRSIPPATNCLLQWSLCSYHPRSGWLHFWRPLDLQERQLQPPLTANFFKLLP